MPKKHTTTKKAAKKPVRKVARKVAKKPTSKKSVKAVKKVEVKAPVVKRRRKITRKRVVRHLKKYGWKYLSWGLMLLLSFHLLFTYNFTFKRGVLKMSEWLGMSRQTYDFSGHRIFEVNGITYVAYDHPLVTARVLFDPDCEGEFCNLDSLKEQILTNLTPAIHFREIDVYSAEGIQLANQTEITAVPAFVFDENIKLVGNFEFIEDFFVERGRLWLLKTPPGKYIRTPHEETAHVKGAEDPLVTITEFSSFTCAFCAEFSTTLDELMKSHGNVVQLRYIHFNRGGVDRDLMQASECAAEQGKFWEMHDKLFENQGFFLNEEGEFNLALIAGFAIELELDEKKFAACLNDEERFTSKFQAMQRVAADYSVQASPSFFANDFYNEGSLDLSAMTGIVDELVVEATTVEEVVEEAVEDEVIEKVE